MNTLSNTKERLYYLDAVRAFALLLGVFFHAGLSFFPFFIGWAVMDISTSHLAATVSLVLHSFRMELFFLVSGYFSHMKFHQMGAKAFLTSRWFRIGIPFIVGWIVLRPLLVSGWVMGSDSMRGEVNIMQGLNQGFGSLLELPHSLLVGTHLWFLYYLMLITLGVIIFRYLTEHLGVLKSKITATADNFINWLAKSFWSPIVAPLPIILCLWFMQRWGVDTPDKSLVPQWPVYFLYLGFYLIGWLLHRQKELLNTLSNITVNKVILCILAIASCIMLAKYEGKPYHQHYQEFKMLFMYTYGLMMWLLATLTIGVCRKLFKKSSPSISYLADASYWIYLVHLPIVIWLQIAVAELAMHWLFKLIAICMLTTLISLFAYHLFVRNTFIGKTLNGKKVRKLSNSDSSSTSLSTP